MQLILKQVSSLEKIFPTAQCGASPLKKASILQNEEFSYQLAFCGRNDNYKKITADVRVISDFPGTLRLYRIKNIPSEMPAYPDRHDDDYVTVAPGLFPDALIPIEDGCAEITTDIYHGIWVTAVPSDTCGPGDYQIKIQIKNEAEKIAEEAVLKLSVLPHKLPPQSLIYTQWMHYDCIANVHKTEVFSEEYWCILSKYIRLAVDNGINMILTPLFTPPLDTAVGGQRRTAQLVGVIRTAEGYHFDFSLLDRFFTVCRDLGIQYFEMSHLFTQWGAACAPKIMGTTEEEGFTQLFGWDTPADSPQYRAFLSAFLPQLTDFLKAKGLCENVFFHISDEPSKEHLENYLAAKELVMPYLSGFKLTDALSDYDFYEQGICSRAIPAVNHIEPFLVHKVENLWTYYCCSQCVDVSNRFFAMPSRRNRILGIQLYKFDIQGFLHWGYNFYNTGLSTAAVNPYEVSDAGCSFPSGDAFSVYPYQDGAVPSLRMKVFYEGLQDLRLLRLLEQKIGRDAVIQFIDDTAGMELTFTNYPKTDAFLFTLREKAHELLMKEGF